MKRLASVLIASVLGVAAIPAAAPAASYDVLVCRAAPGNASHAFTATNDNSSRLDAVDNCSSTEDYTGGLYAADALGAGFTTPKGQEVRWRMAAPTGLKITTLTGSIYVRNVTDDSWTPFFRTFEGSVFMTCEIVPGDGSCSAGWANYFPNSPLTFAMNTDGIEFGVSCDIAAGSCGNGVSLTSGLATISGARITIADNGQPTVSNLGGSLLAGGTLQGSKTVTFDAADASGISTVRLYVDGVMQQGVSRTCDYTYAKPCQDVVGGSLTVDTTTLSDGTHAVRAAAVDAAGNEQQSAPQSITVHNAPPPSGGGGGGVGGGGGGGASPPGGSSTPSESTASPAPPSTPVPAPGFSMPSVPIPVSAAPRAELVDAHGRLNSASWRGRIVRSSGQLTASATGEVTVSLERRIGSRLYRVAKTVRLQRGRWKVALSPTGPLARTRSATLRVVYGGSKTVKKTTMRRTLWRR